MRSLASSLTYSTPVKKSFPGTPLSNTVTNEKKKKKKKKKKKQKQKKKKKKKKNFVLPRMKRSESSIWKK